MEGPILEDSYTEMWSIYIFFNLQLKRLNVWGQ